VDPTARVSKKSPGINGGASKGREGIGNWSPHRSFTKLPIRRSFWQSAGRKDLAWEQRMGGDNIQLARLTVIRRNAGGLFSQGKGVRAIDR